MSDITRKQFNEYRRGTWRQRLQWARDDAIEPPYTLGSAPLANLLKMLRRIGIRSSSDYREPWESTGPRTTYEPYYEITDPLMLELRRIARERDAHPPADWPRPRMQGNRHDTMNEHKETAHEIEKH